MSVHFSSSHRAPVRTCVGCRKRAERSDLLRLVVSGDDPVPSGTGVDVVPDLRVRMPGRGAWIHPRRSCLEQAQRRRAFVRAFRRPGPFSLDAVLTHLGDQPAEQH